MKLHRFQEYLRQETNLGPGTVVQYRREIAKVMDEKGLTTVTLSEVEGHSLSAFRKYFQWLENRVHPRLGEKILQARKSRQKSLASMSETSTEDGEN